MFNIRRRLAQHRFAMQSVAPTMGCNKDRACGTDRLFCPIFLFDKGPGEGVDFTQC